MDLEASNTEQEFCTWIWTTKSKFLGNVQCCINSVVVFICNNNNNIVLRHWPNYHAYAMSENLSVQESPCAHSYGVHVCMCLCTCVHAYISLRMKGSHFKKKDIYCV